jgi:trimethylguanosine synthase
MKMDVEGLYSLTVRPLALEIARLLPGDTVLDAFCGIGGNAIAFALSGKRVYAVELNRERLEMARANAVSAGVLERITFHHGDAQEALCTVKSDSVFLDPPWGGSEYAQCERFRLDSFKPDARPLLVDSLLRFANVGIKLPGNFDFNELSSMGGRHFDVIPNIHNEMLLHYTAVYVPELRR